MTRPDVPADEDLGARFRPLFQRIAGEAVLLERHCSREAWFAKQPAAVITRAPISEPVDELAGG